VLLTQIVLLNEILELQLKYPLGHYFVLKSGRIAEMKADAFYAPQNLFPKKFT
jgi:hypothetical protein